MIINSTASWDSGGCHQHPPTGMLIKNWNLQHCCHCCFFFKASFNTFSSLGHTCTSYRTSDYTRIMAAAAALILVSKFAPGCQLSCKYDLSSSTDAWSLLQGPAIPPLHRYTLGLIACLGGQRRDLRALDKEYLSLPGLKLSHCRPILHCCLAV